MPISFIVLLLVHPSLHASTSATILQLIGTPRSKPQWKQLHMALSKTATEQIMDLRYTLRYLGVPIKSKSFRFGNNRSVVNSAILPHSSLSKRHNILAFQRVREAIAANIIDFHWIQSEYNLSDMLSKHWELIQFPPKMDENWWRYGGELVTK